MREENLKLASKLASKFNKKYGVITYSGTLAIELALISLNLKKKAKVLVMSETCYSIINTILKLDLIPVIIETENKLYLTDDDVLAVLEHQQIDCLLLVHQYGIINKINTKEYQDRGIKIIEDMAQVWDINNDYYQCGQYSDIVTTSFGKTKPLSYGIGGGLFFNDKDLLKNVDYSDNESRENNAILLSYTYPLCENINYDNLVELGKQNTHIQRSNALKYYKLFQKYHFINCLPYGEDVKNTWHRFPIWIDDKKIYDKFVEEATKHNLAFQLFHDIDLFSLKRNQNAIPIHRNRHKTNYILLRTRNIDIDKQLAILNTIIEIVLNA